MSHFFGMRGYIGRKYEIDETAVIVHQLLTFCIHRCSLLLFEFGSSSDKEFIEAGIFPEGLILSRILGISQGEHAIGGWSTEPLAGNERLFEPDIVPICIVGFPNDF